jgi:hypothetical protein
MAVVNLSALADGVRKNSSGGQLDRIEAALAVSEELTSGADDLIGQFVAEARAAGYSWTEIGQRIGVSKQAARQRFAQREASQPSGSPEPRRRRRRRGRAGGARCSFCGKPKSAGIRLIAGPGVYICTECVRLCTEILAEESEGQ